MGCTSSTAIQSNDTSTMNVEALPKEKMKTFSAGELYNMRKEFWESRVDGIPEIYVALKSVCEAILNDDKVLADAILQASNITSADSTSSRYYDERGHEYIIPTYCWSNQGPANFQSNKSSSSSAGTDVPDKKIASDGQDVQLKIQICPGDRNLVVQANTCMSVADLKGLICKESTIKTEKNLSTEPAKETRQRMIFMGKELRNGQYLDDLKIDGTRVIQVFLRKE